MAGTADGRPHLRPLDGLRGIAVLGVIAFHLASVEGGTGGEIVRGGWLGVDVFFTLSGYLITSLLFAEVAAHGRVDLRAFWRRRVRRLQPAALLAVVAISATATWWSAPGTGRLVRQQAFAALTGLANWQLLWARRPYAAGIAPSGFEHFWSLAVEEQFYVVWPLLIAGLALVLRHRRPHLPKVVLGLAAGGVALSWTLLSIYPLQRGYLGTDARMGAILLGVGLAAVLPMDRVARGAAGGAAATVAAWSGLVVTLVLWATAGWPPHRSLALVLPAQGMATVALLGGLVLAPRCAPARLLATRPLVAIGRVSYGLYLWHWPVFVLLTERRVGHGWAVTTAVRLLAVGALTSLSWRLVERPVRIGHILRRTRVALPVALSTAALVSVVAAGSIAAAPSWATSDGRLRVATARPVEATSQDPVLASGRRAPRRVLLVGDSIATSLASGPTGTLQGAYGHLFEDLAARGIAAGGATISGCPVVEQMFMAEQGINRSCVHFQRQRLPEAMRTFKPDLVVWYSRQEAYPGMTDDGASTTSNAVLRARYAARLHWFAAQGARVLLVSPGPNGKGFEAAAPMGRPESMVELDHTLSRVARDNPDVVVGLVHMQELLCGGARIPCPDRRPDGGRYRSDGIHFFDAGEPPASQWLADRIAAVDLGPLPTAGQGAQAAPQASPTRR